MPEWKPEVLEAFQFLNIATDATHAEAAKAYKTQAVRHHPDKNPGDPAATQRFQRVGAAWDVCQRHYENPSRSYVEERGSGDFYGGDEDDRVDPEDVAFFRFMFEEMLFGRYSGASRRDYRSRRGPRVYFSPSPYFQSSYPYSPGGYSGTAQLKQEDNYANERNQSKKQAEYEQRLREFEQEIAAEKRELQKRALEKSKDESRRASAYQQAFQAARTGKTSTVINLVEEYGLDVNSPEKTPKSTSKKTNFQTLLHAACRSSDEGLILFLLDKGAIPDAINDAKLHPFHVAILCGNLAVVKFFLLRRVNGRFTPGCHPSKAAPDGHTPLQLAISAGKADMIALMTKEATVHDVERCWQQTDVAQFKEILSAKKGFVDPHTKELLRQETERRLADERAREEQKVADERARVAEKTRIKEERAQKRAAEQLARQQEQEALEEERRRKVELARQAREAEEAAHRKAELEARQKMAAEARRRAEHEARVQAEAEAARQAAEARVRAEAQARQLAEEQERAQRQAEEESRLRKATKAEAKRIQREAEAALVRQEAEAEARRQAAVQAEALRIAVAENARLQQVAAQEAERSRRAALEQQRLEAKRAETLRRLEAQAEEHRRQAEARARAEELERSAKLPVETTPPPASEQRRKVSKKQVPRDLSQLSAEELQKRAAQSARDKTRIAEEKRRKLQEANANQRPGTPESMLSNGRPAEDYIPPTPVSMPSPSQRRLPMNPPPLVPRHTRPNIEARTLDGFIPMLGPEDIQTGAIPDDLFAVERPAPARESGPPFRGYGRGRGYRGRGRGRGRVS